MKMSIRYKLLLSFLLISFLIVPVIIYTISSTNALKKNFIYIVDDAFPRFHALLEIKNSTMTINAFIANLESEIANTPTNANTPTKIGAAKDRLFAYLSDINYWKQSYQRHSVGEKELSLNIQTLDNLLDDVSIAALDIFQSKESNLPEQVIAQKKVVLDRAQTQLKDFIERSVIAESLHLENEKKESIEEANQIYWVTIVLSGIIILLAIGTSLLLASLISRPLIYLKNFASSITQDNLDKRAKIMSQDETGELARSINLMLQHLSSAKKQLSNEKEFLNTILDNLQDGIIACDDSGKITLLNDVLAKNFEVSKVDHPLIDLSDYFSLYTVDKGKELSENESPLHQALAGEKIHNLELLLVFRNGESRDVIVNGQPIVDHYGNKLGAVIAIHDVTEVKETDKMKSEFVSLVSHELRTPLTAIRGSVGLLLSGNMGKFEDKVEKLLEISYRNCDRLLLLVNDLLDMEKIKSGKMKLNLKVVEVNHLVKDAVVANEMYCEKFKMKIKLIETANEILIEVDPDRLLQVLANLISNAAKFAFPNTLIVVKILDLDNQVRISVCNEGVGIPAEFQNRIFQKFSQADSSSIRSKGGTGLGLNISKAIVEKLGGSINFKSAPNEQTIFYVDLPQFNGIKSKATQDLPSNKKLLICDNRGQGQKLATFLKDAGYAAEVAHTLEEAQSCLSKTNYYALLLDMVFPNNQQFSKLIRDLRHDEKTRHLPIIVTSMDDGVGKAVPKGAAVLVVDWLEQPSNENKLLEAISRIVDKDSTNLPHILHVEDNPDIQYMIASLLENKAKITVAGSIRETIVKLNMATYDLVILDLSLPDGSGTELLTVFSKFKIPIIVFSAYNLEPKLEKYVEVSLVKSQSSNEELLKIITELLNSHDKKLEMINKSSETLLEE